MTKNNYQDQSELLLLKVRANLFREWKQIADDDGVEASLSNEPFISTKKIIQNKFEKEAVGGHLFFYQDKLIFSPHSFNIDTSTQEILRKDIKRIMEINTFGLIVETSTQKFQFVLSQRRKVINVFNIAY